VVIIMKPDSEADVIEDVINKIEDLGFQPHPIYGVINTVIAVIGDRTQEPMDTLQNTPGVKPLTQPAEACPEWAKLSDDDWILARKHARDNQ